MQIQQICRVVRFSLVELKFDAGLLNAQLTQA